MKAKAEPLATAPDYVMTYKSSGDPRMRPFLESLPVLRLSLDPANPRKQLSEERDRELQDSLKDEGQKLPLLVRPAGNGGFYVTDGNRRLRAMLALEWKEALCIVSHADDKEAFITQLIIHVQSDNLRTRDLAAAVRLMRDSLRMDVAAIAARISKRKPWVYQLLEVSDLPEALRQLDTTGKVRDVRTLVGLNQLRKKHPEQAATLIARAKEHGLPREELLTFQRSLRTPAVTKAGSRPSVGSAPELQPVAGKPKRADHSPPSEMASTTEPRIGPELPWDAAAAPSASAKHSRAQAGANQEKRARMIRLLRLPETITDEELLDLLIDWYLKTNNRSDEEADPRDASSKSLH